MDIPLTDYSSIYFDFIIKYTNYFSSLRFRQYIGIRGLNFDFYSNSTGLKLNNNSSYINSLKIYFEDPSTEKAVRIRVINKFMYDKSSECIIEKIR